MNKRLLDALVKELPDKLGDVFGLAPGKRDACTTWSRLLAEVLSEFGIAAEVKPVYAMIINQAAIDYLQKKISLEEAQRRKGKIQTFGDIHLGQEYQHAVCYIPAWNVVVDLTIEPRFSKLVPSHPYWAEWGHFPWWVRAFEFKNYPLEYRLYEIRPTEVKKAKEVIRDIVRRYLSQVAPMTSPLDELRTKLLEATESRRGRCYELAWQHIDHQDEGTLVHGRVYSPNLERMIDHAWVVTEPGYVYEPVTGLYFEKDSMYKIYKMQEINTYTPTEARKMAVRTGHYGPWSEEDRRKARVTQVTPQTLLEYSKVPPSAY